MSDQDSAITANEKFYKAFNARDLSAMKEIWSSHQNVTCVHPGWSPLNAVSYTHLTLPTIYSV